ncbi:hypothetical protein ACIQ1S_22585 [Streptomyces griseus]|uniref:hypothetical protein n=1 Tax=Streptomyces griseus TaxID=1911 RepID=UPI0037F90E06
MAVTLSLVALFGLVLFFLLRSGSLKPGSAFTATGFGFSLATTGAAGPINEMAAAIVDAIPNI